MLAGQQQKQKRKKNRIFANSEEMNIAIQHTHTVGGNLKQREKRK